MNHPATSVHIHPLVQSLVKARLHSGRTQELLALQAGISRRALGAIEAGGDCTLSTLTKLSQALAMDMAAAPRVHSLPTLSDMQEETRQELFGSAP